MDVFQTCILVDDGNMPNIRYPLGGHVVDPADKWMDGWMKVWEGKGLLGAGGRERESR